MKHTTVLTRCTRLLGGAALVAGLAVGGAGVAAADGPPDDIETTAYSSAAQSRAHDHWTADRMEAAVPAEELAPEGAPASAEVEKGTPTTVKSRSAQAPGRTTKAATSKDTVGKVFFTQGGVDYVCSGNAGASANGVTVTEKREAANGETTAISNFLVDVIAALIDPRVRY